jgi:hypothetical protein
VYDREIETAEPEDIGNLAAQLSRTCGGITIPLLNYDDDVLWFRIYDTGKLMDEYNSAPAYFEGSRSALVGGNEQVIAGIFNASESADRVRVILHEREYVNCPLYSSTPSRLSWHPNLSGGANVLTAGELEIVGGRRIISRSTVEMCADELKASHPAMALSC